MKTLSGGLTTHVAQEVTTLATCWKCTLRDTSVFGFTDHDSDVPVDGVTYVASGGYTPSAIQSTTGLQDDTLNVQGVLSLITNADLRAGRWDFADIEIFQVNYKDLTMGTIALRKGNLGQVRMGKVRFEADLLGLISRLQQSIGRIYTPGCNADLGDARCGINLATFPDGTVTGAVTTVTSRRQFADTSLTQPTGWFDGGKVTFTSGLNAGTAYAREVKTYNATGDIVVVQEPFPYVITVADAYTITAGCLKRYAEDCRTKFNNVVNFRGFPSVPGTDRMTSGT